jgi:RHS repeat-associated protein
VAAPVTVSGAQGQAMIDCPLRFPGQYHDAETGLDYNYFRYYDPATGRYTGPDVLGLSPALNHHAYTDNPVIGMDALGLADFISDAGRNILRQVAARHGGIELPDSPHGRGNFMFPNRRSARAAASEIAGDFGGVPKPIPASEYRGAPPRTNPNKIMGMSNAPLDDEHDFHGTAGWRDDEWGHDFGKGNTVGPHVNAWNKSNGIDNSHLYYQAHPNNCP